MMGFMSCLLPEDKMTIYPFISFKILAIQFSKYNGTPGIDQATIFSDKLHLRVFHHIEYKFKNELGGR